MEETAWISYQLAEEFDWPEFEKAMWKAPTPTGWRITELLEPYYESGEGEFAITGEDWENADIQDLYTYVARLPGIEGEPELNDTSCDPDEN